MDTASFDALAASKRLREAGFDEPRAEAAAAVVRHAAGVDRDALAAKAGLAAAVSNLETRMAARPAALEARLAIRFFGGLPAVGGPVAAALELS